MVRRVKEKRVDKKTKDMIKRVRWILEISDSPETSRGLETERYVIQALEYHRKKKTQFPGGSGRKPADRTREIRLRQGRHRGRLGRAGCPPWCSDELPSRARRLQYRHGAGSTGDGR